MLTIQEKLIVLLETDRYAFLSFNCNVTVPYGVKAFHPVKVDRLTHPDTTGHKARSAARSASRRPSTATKTTLLSS